MSSATQQLLAERAAFYRRAFDHLATTAPEHVHPHRAIAMVYAYLTDNTLSDSDIRALDPLLIKVTDTHCIPRSVAAVETRMAHVRWVNRGGV